MECNDFIDCFDSIQYDIERKPLRASPEYCETTLLLRRNNNRSHRIMGASQSTRCDESSPPTISPPPTLPKTESVEAKMWRKVSVKTPRSQRLWTSRVGRTHIIAPSASATSLVAHLTSSSYSLPTVFFDSSSRFHISDHISTCSTDRLRRDSLLFILGYPLLSKTRPSPLPAHDAESRDCAVCHAGLFRWLHGLRSS